MIAVHAPQKNSRCPGNHRMTRYLYHLCLIAVAISMLAGSAFAQEADPAVADSDRDSLVRATRIMRKIDKDGNGTFEKQEDAAAWRRYRKLDAIHDQVISIDELRQERIACLESGAERKLNIVYKQTPQGNLLMDLYYPTIKSNKAGSPCPVIVYAHGGGCLMVRSMRF